MATRNKLWTNVDWVTFVIFLVLTIMGWFNIYAAVYDDTHRSIFDLSQRYGKQIVWIAAALIIGFTILIIDSNFYVLFAYVFYGVVVLSLLLVLVAGVEINGSKSWFVIGEFRIQPSEFGKFATSLALAKIMSGFNFRLRSLSSYLKIGLIIMAPACLILMQPDAGSAVVFAAYLLVLYREGMPGIVLFLVALTVVLFLFAMLLPNYVMVILIFLGALVAHYVLNQKSKPVFSALGITSGVTLFIWILNMITGSYLSTEQVVLSGVLPSVAGIVIWVLRNRLKRTMVVVVFFIASLTFSYSVDFVFNTILSKHHRNRIEEVLGIRSDPLGASYNVNQSKIAIGSGGFLGKGFLNGTQTKFNFVPEQSTDFIFCTVGEEWGFVGSVVVIGLFILLFFRLIFLAERQRSSFSRIYGYSVTVILFTHFFINIGMTIGIMPVIGIPLPFFSYGGSSLWAFTILLFIFLRLDASRLDRLV